MRFRLGSCFEAFNRLCRHREVNFWQSERLGLQLFAHISIWIKLAVQFFSYLEQVDCTFIPHLRPLKSNPNSLTIKETSHSTYVHLHHYCSSKHNNHLLTPHIHSYITNLHYNKNLINPPPKNYFSLHSQIRSFFCL